jgi:hypothetical protein
MVNFAEGHGFFAELRGVGSLPSFWVVSVDNLTVRSFCRVFYRKLGEKWEKYG